MADTGWLLPGTAWTGQTYEWTWATGYIPNTGNSYSGIDLGALQSVDNWVILGGATNPDPNPTLFLSNFGAVFPKNTLKINGIEIELVHTGYILTITSGRLFVGTQQNPRQVTGDEKLAGTYLNGYPSMVTTVLGGPTDLWGLTGAMPSTFNAYFGFRGQLPYDRSNWVIERVRLKIYYTTSTFFFID